MAPKRIRFNIKLKIPFFAFVFAASALAQPSPKKNSTMMAPVPSSPTPADLIFINGPVLTDPETPKRFAEALSVRNGIIQTIGSREQVQHEKGPNTKVVDLHGRVLVPGFNDAHAHLVSGGLTLSRLNLSGARTVSELQTRLKNYSDKNPARMWLLGYGWDESILPNKRFPDRFALDSVVNDRPVFLWHADQHTALLNSKALAKLGFIEKKTGEIDHNYHRNEKGELSGVLFDVAAFDAAKKADDPSKAEILEAIKAALNLAVQNGITSVQGGPIHGLEEVSAIADLYRENQLHVRYSGWGDLEKPEELTTLRKKCKDVPEEWLRLDTVKGFIDGVLNNRSAALEEPYTDQVSNSGTAFYAQEKLSELVAAANRLGLGVALHATGDRAAAMGINAYGGARRKLFNSRIRNRIEHAEVVPAASFARFAENNIVVVANPSHLSYETEAQAINDARLGSKRIKSAFAWRNFLSASVHLAFGTDWPVMPLNPMYGLFGAVYRQHLNGKPARGWQPMQKLTMVQAVDAYTLGSAYATREEHLKGSLREGKFADLVVLDRDLFHARPLDLLKTEVIMTIVAGKIVYERP